MTCSGHSLKFQFASISLGLCMLQTDISNSLLRVESGKAGCFSPKISRKEKVRREKVSLRVKFGLGKSSKDVVSIFHHFSLMFVYKAVDSMLKYPLDAALLQLLSHPLLLVRPNFSTWMSPVPPNIDSSGAFLPNTHCSCSRPPMNKVIAAPGSR